MKQDKYQPNEKQLCKKQVQLIKYHTDFCDICKKSYSEFKRIGISSTPPCKEFQKALRSHIDSCKICSISQKKWNEDAIPITEEMRELSGNIIKNVISNPSKVKTVISYLIKKLELTSKEVSELKEQTDKTAKQLTDRKDELI